MMGGDEAAGRVGVHRSAEAVLEAERTSQQSAACRSEPPVAAENKLLSHVKRGQQALMARRRKVSLASTTGHVGFVATSCSIQTFGSQYSP